MDVLLNQVPGLSVSGAKVRLLVVECPRCGSDVVVSGDGPRPHRRAHVTGSHVELRPCEGPALMRGR